MITYLLLHGVITILVLFTLKGLESAPPRLRLWLTIATMAIWLLPIPLYRPTLSMDHIPQPLVTTIQVFSPAASPKATNVPAPQKSAPTKAPLSISQWLVFVIFLLGLLKWGHARLTHRTWLQRLKQTSTPMQDLTPVLAWGITAPIRIMPGYGAMTAGIRRPHIWVGEQHLHQPEMPSLLLHEWHHIKQNDNIWTTVTHFFECLFWWNPLVLLLGRRARLYIELGCDQKCIQVIDASTYQSAIAMTLHRKILHPFNRSLVTAAQGSKSTTITRLKQLNRRFKMNKKQLASLLTLFAFCGLAFAFPKTNLQPLVTSITLLQTEAEAASPIPRVGQNGVKPPIFIKKVAPKYPERAQKIKLQGYVILEAVLRKDGSVTDMKVLRGLGKGRFGFEDASMDALSQWEFKPGRVDGEPSDVRMTLKIDFVLDQSAPSLPITDWAIPDYFGDMETGLKRPIAKMPLKKRETQSENNLTIPVDVEIDPNGELTMFEADHTVLSQLMYPDLAIKQLKKQLGDIEWVPATVEGQPYRTLMRIQMKIRIGEDEDPPQ